MHFSHDQVRQILIRAASEDASTSLPRATDVTTMDDVIRLGKEAGISPDAVRRAALLVASGAVEPVEVRERTFCTPTWLSRRVVLGREISGKEWTRIMARLRITLDTKGKERSDGTVREWRSDDIRVTVESTGRGDLLHVTARQASPRLLPLIGVGLFGCGSLMLAGFLSVKALSPLWFIPALIVLVGAGGAVSEGLAIRRRAARHAALLEKLAEELPVLLSPTEE